MLSCPVQVWYVNMKREHFHFLIQMCCLYATVWTCLDFVKRTDKMYFKTILKHQSRFGVCVVNKELFCIKIYLQHVCLWSNIDHWSNTERRGTGSAALRARARVTRLVPGSVIIKKTSPIFRQQSILTRVEYCYWVTLFRPSRGFKRNKAKKVLCKRDKAVWDGCSSARFTQPRV